MAKNLPANAGDARDGSLIPESGGRNSSPLQYSCLENFMDRGEWRVKVWGCKKSNMTEDAHRCRYILYRWSTRLTPKLLKSKSTCDGFYEHPTHQKVMNLINVYIIHFDKNKP